jgi:hypothetical protein
MVTDVYGREERFMSRRRRTGSMYWSSTAVLLVQLYCQTGVVQPYYSTICTGVLVPVQQLCRSRRQHPLERLPDSCGAVTFESFVSKHWNL